MCSHQINLAFMLLNEHFGPIVANVAKVLMTNGLCVLPMIVKQSKYSVKHVRLALTTLIVHQFVWYETNESMAIEYHININRVLTILRYPKYIYVAKMLFADEGEYMIEELLRHGQLSMSDTIQRVVNKLTQALNDCVKADLPQRVFSVFTRFVETRFIQRAINDRNQSTKNDINSDTNPNEQNPLLYVLPGINLNLIKIENTDSGEHSGEPASCKRRKTDTQEDTDIYWRININRFHQYLRDQVIIDAIKMHYDDSKAGDIARIILRLSEVKTHPYADITSPLSKHEIIKECVKEKILDNECDVDSYLHCFQIDTNYRFITKTEDRGDGMYSLNILKILEKLVENSLASIVENRYCSKSARIYRLLLEKKYLQQKQIEDFAMIPAKEAKEFTYSLYFDKMIKLLHCPKTTDYHSSFYLFTVDMVCVSKDILDRCYQAVYNAITRRLHETQQNKTLLERKNIIDALISNLQQQFVQDLNNVEQQIQDLKDSFSTHDSELLEKVNNSVKLLEHSELQIDETIFLLQTWLLLHQMNSKDALKIESKEQFYF